MAAEEGPLILSDQEESETEESSFIGSGGIKKRWTNEEWNAYLIALEIEVREGRAPIGRARPLTPWGKPALGMKTRKRKKMSDAYILRRRS